MASSATDDDYDSDDSCGSSDTDAINDSDTDSGNSSDADTRTTDRTDGTSDVGSEDEDDEDEDEDDESSNQANIVWSGFRKTIPIIIFHPECIYGKVRRLYSTGEKHHLAYKMVRTECKIVRQLLNKHGFHDVHPNSSDFNLMWTGSHVKPYTLRSFTEFQKINHFPRSYEITRKDRLYKNFQRMQQSKGARHFDFLPQTFITPSEYDDLNTAHMKERGTWIVKPVASSRGRGISLINSPQNVPMDGNHVVSRYISNPLLIDGFKFDCRLYVAVTSFDPLRAYLYEEGLARFATVQYNHTNKTIKNVMMHLTNYSLNKRSNDYVRCNDLNIEDYGNKWSFGAMMRYLQKKGKDVKAMLGRIEDVVIKTLLCAELPVATACKMFMPHRGNCFELYGFDILIDDNLKPWVLEVNLSPSLACDAPIDLKIKSNMVSDLFSLTGFIAQDPMMRRVHQSKRNQDLAASSVLRQQRARIGSEFLRQRPHSAGVSSRPSSAKKAKDAPCPGDKGLTAEERRVVVESKDEYQRRGGWLRIFPSPCSWDKYKNFLESRSNMNQILFNRLYPDKRVTSAFLQDLADRELEEHLRQFSRKLVTTENLTGRKQVRNKVRQRYPALKRIISAGVVRSAVKSDRSDREPLVQGKLDSGHPARPASSRPLTTAGHSTAASSQSSLASGKAQQQQQQQQGKGGGGAAGGSSSGGTDKNPAGKPPVGPSSRDSKGARMVLEVPKKPSPEEIRESVNVPEIMNSGGDISKLQARLAFATYLMRVQQRLLDETSKPAEQLEESAQNDEQMDLVLRFLKRAASNLQQPFKVIVPSRKLPPHDRRRILAKQLVDFVQLYNKETEQMHLQRKMEQNLPNPSKDKETDFSENRFDQFTSIATESELEELLTSYTKQNKSASIFLGTSTSSPGYKSMNDLTSRPASSSSATQATQSTQSAQPGGGVPRRSSVDGLAHSKGSQDAGSGDAACHPSAAPQKRPQSTPSSGIRSVSSSEAAAVSVYSAPSHRQRPVSAKTGHRDAGGNLTVTSRPVSAYVRREPPGGEIAARLFSESSQQAIQEALQRLARRQAVRQYSANSSQNQNATQQYLNHYHSGGGGSGMVAGSAGVGSAAAAAAGPVRLSSAVRGSHGSRSTSSLAPTPQQRAWDGMKSQSSSSLTDGSKSATRAQAQASVGSAAGEDQGGEGALWSLDQPAAATAVAAGSQHFQAALATNSASSVSGQSGGEEGGRVAQRQPLSLQEKRAISHSMTQQSKAKHLEKVAQAHTNASALREALHRNVASSGHASSHPSSHPSSQSSSHAQNHIKPRPPVRSSNARKPVSVQRMARTTQLEEAYPNAHPVSGAVAGSSFYSGLKYNNMTGTTKAQALAGSNNLYNSGYQSAAVRH